MYTLHLLKLTLPVRSHMWVYMWMLALVCTCSLAALSLKREGIMWLLFLGNTTLVGRLVEGRC
jgi:hypothetical protein